MPQDFEEIKSSVWPLSELAEPIPVCILNMATQSAHSQFLFVVTFTTFLFNCVEYDILFANRAVNHTGPGQNPLDRNKVTLPDAILPSQQCTDK